MTNLWDGKVTIYNDIPATPAENRRFERFVIELCNIQGGIIGKIDGTVENIVNAKTVWTRDVERYKPPMEYYMLPIDVREDYFTVQIGDFVVIGEVDEVVENAKDFAALQAKYENGGFRVSSVSPSIHGMSVDNISFTNV